MRFPIAAYGLMAVVSLAIGSSSVGIFLSLPVAVYLNILSAGTALGRQTPIAATREPIGLAYKFWPVLTLRQMREPTQRTMILPLLVQELA
jgi:hypothetical protein